jgi:hypothetical protein
MLNGTIIVTLVIYPINKLILYVAKKLFVLILKFFRDHLRRIQLNAESK